MQLDVLDDSSGSLQSEAKPAPNVKLLVAKKETVKFEEAAC